MIDARTAAGPLRRAPLWVVAPAALALGACGETPAPPPQPARPVTYVELARSSPAGSTLLSGTVESWKREELGFRVPGRVRDIVDPGVDVIGRTVDEEGHPITEGTVIATLDDEKFRIALDETHAALKSAEAALAATRTELEESIPARMNEARAEMELQEVERARYDRLAELDAASLEQRDRVRAAFKVAEARVAQVEADRVATSSDVRAREAQVLQAKQAVHLAQVNFDDCALVSPFTGQIARVHSFPGSYVYRGQPAVTMQMMDPIQVLVAVSQKIDAGVSHNDRVLVRIPGFEEPLLGFVYLKDTFADPSTRTFLITVLVRNRQVEVGVSPELAARGLPRAERIWTLEPEVPGASGPYGVEVGALRQDEQGHYVWKVDNLAYEDLFGRIDPLLRVSKVRVTPSEKRIAVLRLFTFRLLDDLGGLDPSRDAILGDLSGPVGESGEVVLRRQRWLLRPGDLARVELATRDVPDGFFVPERAVRSDGTTHAVCVAKPAGGGRHEVALVPVRVGEVIGGLQRVEPVEEGALAEGAKVVVEGAQYVIAGESVALTHVDGLNR